MGSAAAGSAFSFGVALGGWLANSFCQSSWPSFSSAAQVSSFSLRILPTVTSCLTRSTEVSLTSRLARRASGRPSGALMANGAMRTDALSSNSSVCLARLSL
ncbi:hypothetical protein D3C71_1595130 [compost metagenome]